ncbi:MULTISPECIES: ATP-binding protein [Myroides]|uniref:histidine kinase n=1 Tax=Myroides albus TaxID=2562892 RepID=A0A6I3LG22_9FLAO|nr:MULTISPECIES: ATP-binding protein [Myroides]MTG96754.1 hypothetical protein [Myroides albus]MVX35604.1 hypothetical protein [Myroides sp. LoEW2-1]UVD80835.1 histidine kinase [Myroides albus]
MRFSYIQGITYILIIALFINCKREANSITHQQSVEQLPQKKSNDSLANQEMDSLLHKALRLRNNEENRNYSLELLKKVRNLDNFQSLTAFDSLSNQLILYSENKSDFEIQGQVFKLKAQKHYFENQLDSTYQFLVKAEQSYNQLQDSIELGRISIAKAQIVFEHGIYTESEKEILKGLRLLKNTKDKTILYKANHLLAINLIELFDYSEAKKYFAITKTIVNELKDSNAITQQEAEHYTSHINNNLSHLYYYEGDLQKAKKYALKGLYEYPNIPKESRLYSILLTNLIKAKIDLGEFENLLDYIDEIVALETKYNSKGTYSGGLPSTYLVKAKYYIHQNNLPKALEYCKKAYDRANYEKRYQIAKEALAFMSKYDTTNAQEHISKFLELNDKLFKIERQSKNKFARIEFEAEQLSLQNQQLIADKKNIILISSLILIVFIGTIIMLILYIKNKSLRYQHRSQLADEKIYKLILEQKDLSDNAKFEERKRIAKELHDGIINRIFTTRFHLMQLDGNSNEEQRKLLINELHVAEEEIRTISTILSQEKLSDQNPFDQLIEDLISNQQNAFNSQFHYNPDASINWDRLNSEQKLNVYRILQEVFQNINKHSKATEVIVSTIKLRDGRFQLIIKDNGIGFNSKDNRILSKGTGLKNMKERAKELGANLKITSKPNEGVTILLDLDIYQ